MSFSSRPALPRADGTYPPGGSLPRPYVAGAPSVLQLLNLADRAERSVLSADEAARLRAGIALLAAREARVGRLAAALEAAPEGLLSRGAAARKIRRAAEGPSGVVS